MPSASSSEDGTPPAVSSHSNLVPEKYGSSTRPVRSRTRARWPAASELGAATRRCAGPATRSRGAYGSPGRPVPGDDRLALVGDADRADLLPAELLDDVEQGRPDGLPDLGRVVLDPAGPGEVLGELPVRRDRRPVVGEHGAAAHARRTGIDRDHDRHRREPNRAGRRRRMTSCQRLRVLVVCRGRCVGPVRGAAGRRRLRAWAVGVDRLAAARGAAAAPGGAGGALLGDLLAAAQHRHVPAELDQHDHERSGQDHADRQPRQRRSSGCRAW